jgi:hypothetical protein
MGAKQEIAAAGFGVHDERGGNKLVFMVNTETIYFMSNRTVELSSRIAVRNSYLSMNDSCILINRELMR